MEHDTSGAAPRGSLERMARVLSRPGAAFQGLEQDRWSWVLPAVVVCLLMSLAPQFVYDLYVDRQQTALDGLIERGLLSEEQAQEARTRVTHDDADRGASKVTQQVLLGAVSTFAFRFILPAGLLLAGLRFVLAARIRFTPVLAVVSFAALPAALREILRTPLQAAKGSLDVFFGPAALIGHARSVSAYALSLIDLFDLWVLALIVVGLAQTAGVPRGRAALLVVPLWLAWMLLRIGLKASPFGAAL